MKDVGTKLREGHAAIKSGLKNPARCLVGFDGFTDEIIHVVSKRTSATECLHIEEMGIFGQQILEAAGKSRNFELAVVQKKLGGNAAIMANALLEGGYQVTFAGTIGNPGEIEPLFQEMASRCRGLYCLGPSAHTDALEFQNGKLIMGKLDNLKQISWERLIALIGHEKLLSLFEESDLTAFGNWTMTLEMTSIWKKIASEIAPRFKLKKQRWIFVDLADPAKRTKADLKEALDVLKHLSKTYTVILGLNESEAHQAADVLQVAMTQDLRKSIEWMRESSGLPILVIHTTQKAFAADEHGSSEATGRLIAKPKISTGAGDNFNAGFCHGLLYGLSLQESLLSAVASSGYYVSHGKSATINELADYLGYANSSVKQ